MSPATKMSVDDIINYFWRGLHCLVRANAKRGEVSSYAKSRPQYNFNTIGPLVGLVAIKLYVTILIIMYRILQDFEHSTQHLNQLLDEKNSSLSACFYLLL